jgi:hypothetical protein
MFVFGRCGVAVARGAERACLSASRAAADSPLISHWIANSSSILRSGSFFGLEKISRGRYAPKGTLIALDRQFKQRAI